MDVVLSYEISKLNRLSSLRFHLNFDFQWRDRFNSLPPSSRRDSENFSPRNLQSFNFSTIRATLATLTRNLIRENAIENDPSRFAAGEIEPLPKIRRESSGK